MADSPAWKTIIDIEADRLEEGADVLTAAFESYAFFRHFLAGADAQRDYWDVGRGLMRTALLGRVNGNWPCLGVLDGQRLAGVACVSTPDEQVSDPALIEEEERFIQGLDPKTHERFGFYSEQKAAHIPTEPHMYLAILGVRPEDHGRGFGGALLRRIHDLSAAHPTSTGVALDTQIPDNVSLYEHHGYHVYDTSAIGGATMYWMFRSNDGNC